MSVIEFEKSNKNVPDPFYPVLEEPDLRLHQLRQKIGELHVDTDNLNNAWMVEDNQIEKNIQVADMSIQKLNQVRDASRKSWTILGTMLFFLTAVNLMKAGTTIWRWYQGNRSQSGDNQEQGSKRGPTL